jgi:hypothetical protein
MSSRNFRRRNHRRRSKPDTEAIAPIQQAPNFPECPICNKPVRELPTALSCRSTGTPAHFDCVLKELKDAHELLPQEKLCYLGGGIFGILQFRTTGSNRFTIKKKIPYEDKGSPQDWKKTILIPN